MERTARARPISTFFQIFLLHSREKSHKGRKNPSGVWTKLPPLALSPLTQFNPRDTLAYADPICERSAADMPSCPIEVLRRWPVGLETAPRNCESAAVAFAGDGHAGHERPLRSLAKMPRKTCKRLECAIERHCGPPPSPLYKRFSLAVLARIFSSDIAQPPSCANSAHSITMR